MVTGGLLIELVTALGAALVGSAVALTLRQSPIVGYLVAGILVGPSALGVVGSTEAISQLAEIGIVFLMFVIGLQFSLRELVNAGRVAVLGALCQIALTIAIGYAVGRWLGWGSLESYAFGAVISNSSSTVLGKILSDRGEIDSLHGRIAMAWSSVQDVTSVLLIAILAFGSPRSRAMGPLLGKAALFFFLVLPLSFWLLPWLLRRASALRSREVFSLSVITLALAMAAGASLLGVSVALGAFLTGTVVGESDLAHRILGDATPLRDVFSGIFFVSIGMLLEPRFVVQAWPLVLLTVLLIVVVKGSVTTLLARLLGSSWRVAVLVGAALAPSAEFSFLLARIGLDEGALRGSTFQVLLSATVISILLSPMVNGLAPDLLRRLQDLVPGPAPPPAHGAHPELADHAVVCGYGRVGSIVCALLERHGKPFVVVEEDLRVVLALRARGMAAVAGDAGLPSVLDRAGIRSASLLVLCFPEKMAVRRALDHAREVCRSGIVLARTHSLRDRFILQGRGADEAVVGELELALELGRRALRRLHVDADAVEDSIAETRRTLGS